MTLFLTNYKRHLVLVMAFTALVFTACQSVNRVNGLHNMPKSQGNNVLALGNSVDMTLLTGLAAIMANPELYVDKSITVKGKIDKACKVKGCWADIVSGDEKLRIKVADDVIVIPLYTIGHDAYATGVLKRYDYSLKKTIAYLEHMAKDAGEAFDPASVTEPMSFYQLQADGIRIL